MWPAQCHAPTCPGCVRVMSKLSLVMYPKKEKLDTRLWLQQKKLKNARRACPLHTRYAD